LIMNELDTRILEVMALVFEVPVSDLNEESSQDSIESWDSVKHLNLIVALEEEFGIEIPIDEVGNMISFKLIRLIVSELI
jgi:acyl carrier protein